MIRILSACALVMLATHAHATPFSADAATASSFFNGSYDPGNTIDGSGLSANTAVTEAHANYAANNHWTTAAGTDPLEAWITWSFTTGVDLGGIYIWTHRSNIIASNPGYDPTLFDLEVFDFGGTSLAVFDDVALTPDTAFAQAFSFGTVFANVGSVTFSVEAVQSSPSYTGLAEVAFDDGLIASATQLNAVPLPAGLPLLAGALAGLVGCRRLRRGHRPELRKN